MNQTTWLDDALAAYSPPANPFADARPITRCDICRSTQFVDRPIHDGASLIRECATCRRFLGFPKWHGQELPPA
jgi:hypothetical protein